jgi:hypothetical protein
MISSNPNPILYIHDKWIEVVDSLKLCDKCQHTILFIASSLSEGEPSLKL